MVAGVRANLSPQDKEPDQADDTFGELSEKVTEGAPTSTVRPASSSYRYAAGVGELGDGRGLTEGLFLGGVLGFEEWGAVSPFASSSDFSSMQTSGFTSKSSI
jgi:hypothetical protein